jgi:hypothetical protein
MFSIGFRGRTFGAERAQRLASPFIWRGNLGGSFVAHALAACSVHNRVNALGSCARLAPGNLSRTIGELQRVSGERVSEEHPRRLASPFIVRENFRERLVAHALFACSVHNRVKAFRSACEIATANPPRIINRLQLFGCAQ